ncbi:aldehyde dehydrogenase family protein [Siminovitchia terrae]|uniref:aldehyde dehydrogenase family protein n=1 Tax=Siminovitchia terrae TaxID=1914933 RepID=UPI0028A8203F|nr:aldehyde dehydrogenase family protein [Siminovitchia terrae]
MEMDEKAFQFGSFIDGEEIKGLGRKELEVINPYNQKVIGTISCAVVNDVKLAVTAADKVYHETMKKMPAYERSNILRHAADLLEQQFEDFSRLLTLEAGKPIRESRGEVTRAVQVLRLASEGAKNIFGEQIPLDIAVGGTNQIGFTKRVPLGVVAAITPFNFPLNLALHKIAPAIAAGNTVVLKPAEKTPLSSAMLYKLFDQAGLPKGALNVVMGLGTELVETLVTDPLVKKVSFTGSNEVGWKIDEMAKRKKVTLELGSNAPNIIFSDCDLDHAVHSIVLGGFTFAGQACVSAQRIYVQNEIYDEFINKLVTELKELKMGDPLDEATELGPMITEEAAKRAETWILEAREQGAHIVLGGNRRGTMVEPTVITNVSSHMNVVCSEVFAPIVSIIPFTDEKEVLKHANQSEFGLHAGIFTNNINRAMQMVDAIETSGVWINESSVRRFDHIPYGGIKNSGLGKEGIKYAIEGMTDLKFVGIKFI